ncbi:hypothetical protein G3I40_12320 [Streptomyces sp. SID14478]|uniref:hypothetical protein n=1 Tax=Streptomyces sp. SID14478 TaxID=2706073 RepID=UPI0013DD16C8|nr:hypothetical protein [Streptomyces sp. SID14478]NEB76000.1 hypothetical protein [Streptomyces sp. SID14478]
MKITQYVPLTGVTVRQLVPTDHFSVPLPASASGAARSSWLHVTAVGPCRVLPGYATVSTSEGEITLPYTEPITLLSMTRTLPLVCAHCRALVWVHLNLAHYGAPVEAVCQQCEDLHAPNGPGGAEPDGARAPQLPPPTAHEETGNSLRIPRPRTTGETL